LERGREEKKDREVRAVREDGGCKKVLEMGEENRSLLGLVVVVVVLIREEPVVVIYMMMVDYACICNKKDKENGSGCMIDWDNNDNGVEEFCASRENRNREEMEMEKESGMG
jgi:hypothetical protein